MVHVWGKNGHLKKLIPCHHSKAWCQVVNRRNGHQILIITVNALNKQSQTAPKDGVWHRVKYSATKLLTKFLEL